MSRRSSGDPAVSLRSSGGPAVTPDPAVTSQGSVGEPSTEAARTPGQALLGQMGGISGLIYSALPVMVLVPVSTAFGLLPALIAALSVAAGILIWRLVRRDSVKPALAGFLGVGISALIAWLVGASKGYFLLGIWTSLIWATVFGLSVLIRRPIVGYVWSWVNGHDRSWRRSRRAVLAFDAATLTWVLVFGARFIVQHHLYDADRTGWLGVARIAMGWPLAAIGALVTYLAIRAAQRALHAEDDGSRPVEGADQLPG